MVQRVDSIVLRETRYIAIFVCILSILMQIVFVAIGAWDYTVFLGNLISACAAIFNFLWMGITVQKAVEKDENGAKNTMRTSQALRTLFLFVILALGVLLDCFNMAAVIIPLFFPRLAIALRPLKEMK